MLARTHHFIALVDITSSLCWFSIQCSHSVDLRVVSALGASALRRGFEARAWSWRPTFPSSMPNISVATFRGVLWWLHGPDAFWVSPFTVFPFFVIETLNPDLYRSDLYFSTSTPVSNDPIGTFRVISGWLCCAGAFLVNCFVFLRLADFYSFKLEPSASMLMPNESVWTVCVSDGWPG